MANPAAWHLAVVASLAACSPSGDTDGSSAAIREASSTSGGAGGQGGGFPPEADGGAADLPGLAFASNRGGQYDLYVAKPDGTDRLTDDDALDLFPAFSPDGARVAFASDRGGALGVYLASLADKTITKVETGQGFSTLPAFSPDGAWLAFEGRPDPLGDSEPAFSPEGDRLALTSLRDGNPEVYLVDVAGGGNALRVTDDPGIDGTAAFAPKKN